MLVKHSMQNRVRQTLLYTIKLDKLHTYVQQKGNNL
jgi:hypothetical protein